MCEFCDTDKMKRLMHYDNRKNMHVSFGQYQGVKVDSYLSLQGNMLLLGGSGSYRSDFNCYYEAVGLNDRFNDEEPGARCTDIYMKLSYCPFCGRKLTSTLYEQTKAADDIENLKNEIKKLNRDLEDNSIFMFIHFDDIGVLYDESGHPDFDLYRNNPEHKHREYKSDLTLQELSNYYQNIQCNIHYGADDLNRRAPGLPPEFTFDSKIQCGCFSFGRFYGNAFTVNKEILTKLTELNYIKFDNDAYIKIQEKRQEINNKIKELNNKIKELKKYIKEL